MEGFGDPITSRFDELPIKALLSAAKQAERATLDEVGELQPLSRGDNRRAKSQAHNIAAKMARDFDLEDSRQVKRALAHLERTYGNARMGMASDVIETFFQDTAEKAGLVTREEFAEVAPKLYQRWQNRIESRLKGSAYLAEAQRTSNPWAATMFAQAEDQFRKGGVPESVRAGLLQKAFRIEEGLPPDLAEDLIGTADLEGGNLQSGRGGVPTKGRKPTVLNLEKLEDAANNLKDEPDRQLRRAADASTRNRPGLGPEPPEHGFPRSSKSVEKQKKELHILERRLDTRSSRVGTATKVLEEMATEDMGVDELRNSVKYLKEMGDGPEDAALLKKMQARLKVLGEAPELAYTKEELEALKRAMKVLRQDGLPLEQLRVKQLQAVKNPGPRVVAELERRKQNVLELEQLFQPGTKLRKGSRIGKSLMLLVKGATPL